MKRPELPAIFAGKRRWIFLRLVINGFLQAISIVGSMLLVRHAFDVLLNPAFDDPEVHLFEMTDVSTVIYLAVGLLACTGLAAWLRWMEQVDAELLGQDYVHRVRLRLYDKMCRCAPRALSRRSTGSTMLRFVGDLNALRRWVSLGLARIIVAIIVAILALGFLAYLDRYLALVSFGLLSLGLIWNLRLGPRMHQTISEARRRRGRLAGNINEKIGAFTVIQVFNQEQRERKRFNKHSRHLKEAMIERAHASGRMRVVTDGATAASMGLVLSLGAYEVFRGMTTSGNVVAAMAVVGFISSAFRNLGRVHEHHQSAQVSRSKIYEFMRTKNLKGRSSSLPDLVVDQGEICFQNVSLKDALENITTTAPAGSRVALVGSNGAGKSTLLNIVARLIDPDSGSVSIDGQDISKSNLKSIRNAIGIVSPDLPLLRGSVGYNLRYRLPDASPEDVAKVRELCELDTLIDHLPGGEAFRIQESGKNLSLGQRHRLAVARALLGDPKILIIDEIDANLDPDAASVIDRVLDRHPGTVLMVTRSETRLEKADILWHLANGRLEKTTGHYGPVEALSS